MNAINSLNSIAAPALSQPATKVQQPVEKAVQAPAQPSSLSEDIQNTSSIKRGVIPSLKGAHAGLMKTGAAVALPAVALALVLSSKDTAQALKFASIMTVSGGAIGAAGGLTAANFTDSKAKGALMGAGIGALAGIAILTGTGVVTRSVGGAAFGAVVGGALGAIGGYSGAKVAEQK